MCIHKLFNLSEKPINGVYYSSACDAVHTLERLFAASGRELQQVRGLAHSVRAIFGVQQPALSVDELSRREQLALEEATTTRSQSSAQAYMRTPGVGATNSTKRYTRSNSSRGQARTPHPQPQQPRNGKNNS